MTKEHQELFKEYVSHNYERAEKYFGVTAAIGYASFFTLLRFVERYMSKVELCWVCLFITISLVIFVFWEVFRNIYTVKGQINLTNLLYEPLETWPEAFSKLKEERHQKNKFLLQVWYFVIITVITFAVLPTCWMFLLYLKAIFPA
jgi:hypothetical protein